MGSICGHPRVYVAGPITKGDQFVNVKRAMEVANQLWTMGFIPFVPHLSALWQMNHPRSHQDWLDYDLHWLAQCNVLYRMPGESVGANQEELWARDMEIPIFTTLTGIAKWRDELYAP
jgi:hypothetical protein